MIYLDWLSPAGSFLFPPSMGAPTSFLGGAQDEEHVYRTTLASGMNVTHLTVDLYDVPSARVTDFRLTLRANNAGAPGDLLAVTATVNEADFASGAEATVAVVTPVSIAPADYWIGIHMDGTVEIATVAGEAINRGKLADTFSDGTSVSPGAFTDFADTLALRIWAEGVPA